MQNPTRQENLEQFKAKVNDYEECGFSSDKAIHLAAKAQTRACPISFRLLQEDPVQQRILESTKTFGNQHDMNQVDSIRQAVKLRKDLCIKVLPIYSIEENEEAPEDPEDPTAPTTS